MSLFDALTSVPSRIVAGALETWTETLTDYPTASYSVAYVFSAYSTPVDGPQRFTVTGAETAPDIYAFTFPAGTKPGRYTYEKRITKTVGSVTRVASTGSLVIQPNTAIAQTESYAQTQVTKLKASIEELATSTSKSRSFNGQSSEDRESKELDSQLRYWESIVANEQRALNGLLNYGATYSSRIVTRLDRYSGSYGLPS